MEIGCGSREQGRGAGLRQSLSESSSQRERLSQLSVRILTFATAARPARDPHPQQECRNPVRKDSIQRVGNRMGTSVNKQENVQAECCCESADHPAGNRNRNKDQPERFEPTHGTPSIRANITQVFTLMNCHPEGSEGSAFDRRTAGPSLCSG